MHHVVPNIVMGNSSSNSGGSVGIGVGNSSGVGIANTNNNDISDLLTSSNNTQHTQHTQYILTPYEKHHIQLKSDWVRYITCIRLIIITL